MSEQKSFEQKQNERASILGDYIGSPEYKEAYSAYKEVSDPNYLENIKKNVQKTLGEKTTDWERNAEYQAAVQKQKDIVQNWIKQKEKLSYLMNIIGSNPYISGKSALENANKIVFNKKGGVLDDKIALEQIKQNHRITLKTLEYEQRKKLEETKQTMIALSKNHEAIRKSLIKIFK